MLFTIFQSIEIYSLKKLTEIVLFSYFFPILIRIGYTGKFKHKGEFPAVLLISDSHHPNKPSASPAQSQNQVNHHPVAVSTASCLPTTTYQVNSTSAATAAAQFPDSKGDVDRDRTSPGSDSSTHSLRYNICLFFFYTYLNI